MSNINDASVYDDNYTLLSKIRKLEKRVEELEQSSSSGGDSYILPTATATRLGGIKVGENLTVTNDGTLSATGGGGGGYTLPPATTSSLGGVIVGDNLTIDANGRLSGQAGGGDVSLKQDLLYGQLYNSQIGDFERKSLNAVAWNKDLIQEPDTNGIGSGDRKMQIPSVYALNEVYREALNKGSGGSSLSGVIHWHEINKRLSMDGTDGPLIPANFVYNNKQIGYAKLINAIINGYTSDPEYFETVEVVDPLDSSDTMTITIPRTITIYNFTNDPELFLCYSEAYGRYVIKGKDGVSTINYHGEVAANFIDPVTNYRCYFTLTDASLDITWNEGNGSLESFQINGETKRFSVRTDNSFNTYKVQNDGTCYINLASDSSQTGTVFNGVFLGATVD